MAGQWWRTPFFFVCLFFSETGLLCSFLVPVLELALLDQADLVYKASSRIGSLATEKPLLKKKIMCMSVLPPCM